MLPRTQGQRFAAEISGILHPLVYKFYLGNERLGVMWSAQVHCRPIATEGS